MALLTTSEEFQELCTACRRGDIETVDLMISRGINVNQMDEWNYSPLILASLCGHVEIVKLLLERGSATCDRDTFEGQRCIYGALNDNIRNILLGFEISKTLNLSNQPFASYISSLIKNLNFTSDVMFKFGNLFNASFKLHRFLLIWRCKYFKNKFNSTWFDKLIIDMPPNSDAMTFQFIINYIYLIPCFNNFEQTDPVLLKKFATKLQLVEMLEYIDEIELIPKNNSIQLAKCKNQIQNMIEDVARKDMSLLLQEITDAKIVDKEISPMDKLSFYMSPICPDVILYIETPSTKIYYPCHRAIFCKSQYFETLFNSSFHETQIYQEMLTKDEIIDRRRLLDNASEIPLISIPSTDSKELCEIVLCYLYVDQVDVPVHLAIDTLIIADLLLIERLKTTALISLTKLENFDEISIYDILRSGWQTRMHRLETFAARVIAYDLDNYINTEEFEDIVIESASRIEVREETDSIELIDDIRFYLAKKYAIDLGEDEQDQNVEDLMDYERELNKIDQLLEKLELDA